jgi:hypothetical protein
MISTTQNARVATPLRPNHVSRKSKH